MGVIMNRRSFMLGLSASGLAMSAAGAPGFAAPMGELPETVYFPSLDGHTKLVAYLFKPLRRGPGPAPAMVLLHGRAGPYSSLANGRFNASTLSKRHVQWARFWADRGCFSLVVDSFGPRGLAGGFAAGTHDQRPAEINEVTVRPLDAFGGLQFLAKHKTEIDPTRIGLQGWSNGGSATLAAMASSTLKTVGMPASAAFRAALAFYPGCGLDDHFRDGYATYAPVQILIGTSDEEVSPQSCEMLVQDNRHLGSNLGITIYPRATHDFDDPGTKRQSVPANATAFADSMTRGAAFMGQHLRL
jgi:dienelactone hydrolase